MGKRTGTKYSMKQKPTRAPLKKEQFALEESERKRLIGKRRGINIRIRGWTEETGSGSETYATSVSAAIRELRHVAKSHPNFSVDVYCEGPRPTEPFVCEWIHQRHLAYVANKHLQADEGAGNQV